MGARIQNLPNYVVFDRSFAQSISTTRTGGTGSAVTITGTPALIVDSNLTTYYQAQLSGNNLQELTSIIDYGNVFLNCQYSYKIGVQSGTGQAGATGGMTLSASTDGISYTTITTSTCIDAGETITQGAYNTLAMRYAKIVLSASIQGAGYQYILTLYELRLMGSG